MSKFKIRESYLLLLIVLGLVSLGIYTTYALFTASTTINDVVGITATLDIGKSLTEYEVITVQPNETKLIELNVVNSYNGNIYYGAWYQIVKGNSDNIQIGLYTEKNPNSSSGVLTQNSSTKLLAGITNNNSTSIIVYLGVKGSLTNELNLGSNKTLLPDGFSEGYSVTLNVTNGVINSSSSSTIKVKENENANFTIVPNTGYRLNIDNQTCDGTLDKSTGLFTINNITGNKECNVTISKKNIDSSGANDPETSDSLIPVMYDGSKWVKADTTSSTSTYGWYDYNNKKWANAALVKNYVMALNDEGSEKSVSLPSIALDNYRATNGRTASSTATSTFTITTGANSGTISFEYYTSKNSGTTLIKFNNTTIVNQTGTMESKMYTKEVSANSSYTLTVTYTRDSSSTTSFAYLKGFLVPDGTTVTESHDTTYYFSKSYTSYISKQASNLGDVEYNNGKYVLNSYSSSVYSSSSVGSYVCPDTTATECSTLYKIIEVTDDVITKVIEYTSKPVSARESYINSTPGTEITESDILAYYVWIPRYKYKVWNIKKQVGTQSYNARTQGIDIVFESGTAATGTISCTYSYKSPSSSAGSPNETCTGSNGAYYTHPAFTFGSDNVKGFWMGKFELSSSYPGTGTVRGGGNTTFYTARILPNVNGWHVNSTSNFHIVLQNMLEENNIYGLSTDSNVNDSHVITNMEWGAVAYLTNSKYGKCTNNSCSEVAMNGYGIYEGGEYTDTKTGCGPISSGSTSYAATCNAYNTTLGMTASTTGNVFGVYDMNGGANELVMGNISSGSGSYSFHTSGSGFASSWYTTSTAKYLTTYAYGTSDKNQTAYNRGRLGDAISEVVLTANSNTGGWYSDLIQMPWITSSSNYSWFCRGGSVTDSTGMGIFRNIHLPGDGFMDSTTRAVLIIF